MVIAVQAAESVGDDDMLLSVSPLAKRKLLAPLATICESPELEAHPEPVVLGALACIETFVELDKLHLINQAPKPSHSIRVWPQLNANSLTRACPNASPWSSDASIA